MRTISECLFVLEEECEGGEGKNRRREVRGNPGNLSVESKLTLQPLRQPLRSFIGLRFIRIRRNFIPPVDLFLYPTERYLL